MAMVLPNVKSLEQLLGEFAAVELRLRKLRQRSRVEYSNDVKGLIQHLKSRRVTRPHQLALPHLESYIHTLRSRGYSPLTLRRKVSSIKAFGRFLCRFGYSRSNVAQQLVPPERESPLPRVLTKAEYERLRQVASHNVRDAAIIELLLQTGITLSELMGLTVSDVELPDSRHAPGVLRIIKPGRYHRNRTLPLNWRASVRLRAYLGERKSSCPIVFLTIDGRPLRSRSLQKMVCKHLRLAGIEGASVNTLRTTFAAHLLRRGASLETVQKMMGHADRKTTARYLMLPELITRREVEDHSL
jgi:site-specific recombinase XerD